MHEFEWIFIEVYLSTSTHTHIQPSIAQRMIRLYFGNIGMLVYSFLTCLRIVVVLRLTYRLGGFREYFVVICDSFVVGIKNSMEPHLFNLMKQQW